MNKIPGFRFWGIFLFLTLITFFNGCASKKTVTTKPKLIEETPSALFQKMIENQLDADWFSAKIRFSYSDAEQSVKANGNLHLRYDSLIWMNVRKLGFEVARVKITPDSIFVIDRLNNQYIAEELDYLDRTYQAPVNFSMLQSLMLGHPVLFSIDGFELKESQEDILIKIPDDEMPGTYLISNPDFLLSEMILRELKTDRILQVKLDEYDVLPDKQNFSYFRKINLKEKIGSLLEMELRFSQIEIDNPAEVRFVIPERYTRVR